MIYLFGSQAEAGKRYIDGEDVSVEPYSDLDIAVYFEEIPPAPILTYG
jgi:predicted nucleotidyltransferase